MGRETLLSATPRGGKAPKGGRGGGKGPARPPAAYTPQERLQYGIAAGAVAILWWTGASQIGIQHVIPVFRSNHAMFLAGVAAGGLALLWPRAVTRLGLTLTALLVLAMLVIGYTRYPTLDVRSVMREDPLERVEAVVVLSSDIRKNGALDGASHMRVLHGLELLRQGYARTLVLTKLAHPRKSYVPAVRQLMANLRFEYPIVETPGEVFNTHDEAVEVRKLAAERGWKKVLLVSDPTHMRRARATFLKQGVEVICSPGNQPDFDPVQQDGPGSRYRAFTQWLYERLGYWIYQVRGWI